VLVDLPDERPYDVVRDAVAELGLSLTRLEQRRHRLEDLFESDHAA
jgi:ABC-2 type transport system ATP-binding protein